MEYIIGYICVRLIAPSNLFLNDCSLCLQGRPFKPYQMLVICSLKSVLLTMATQISDIDPDRLYICWFHLVSLLQHLDITFVIDHNKLRNHYILTQIGLYVQSKQLPIWHFSSCLVSTATNTQDSFPRTVYNDIISSYRKIAGSQLSEIHMYPWSRPQTLLVGCVSSDTIFQMLQQLIPTSITPWQTLAFKQIAKFQVLTEIGSGGQRSLLLPATQTETKCTFTTLSATSFDLVASRYLIPKWTLDIHLVKFMSYLGTQVGIATCSRSDIDSIMRS